MKDLKILVVGTFAVLTTVGLNFRHALNDYGVLENSLHVEVLAQSNGTTGGGTTGGGTTGGNTNGSSTSGGGTGLGEGWKEGYTSKDFDKPSYGKMTCCAKSTDMNACDSKKASWGCQFLSEEELK